MTTAKNGLSARTLQRTLGTSYRTAWKMLHRYRIAMVRSEREQLSGIVEIDEALWVVSIMAESEGVAPIKPSL
jgi:hypothetical protein